MAVSPKVYSLFQFQAGVWVRVMLAFHSKKRAEQIWGALIRNAEEHGAPKLEVRRAYKSDHIGRLMAVQPQSFKSKAPVKVLS